MQSKLGPSFDLQRRFVSEIELETITGISRRTWQKHRLLKRGPNYYKIHGCIRYEVEEVVEWIQGCAVNSGKVMEEKGGIAK
jgi:hypothetical protein